MVDLRRQEITGVRTRGDIDEWKLTVDAWEKDVLSGDLTVRSLGAAEQ
jgi:hypothetical protein